MIGSKRYWLLAAGLCISVMTLAQPFPHPMAVSSKGMVVSCQPLAADIGVKILRAGGSAADAFIATTLAEYVTAYGYTSLSGPLNLLYYDAKSKNSIYLNAGINKVSDPSGQFDAAHPIAGQSYVVGGAGRGLEALYQRFGGGKLSFKDVVTPAATLAKVGFPLSSIYGWTIAQRAPLFKSATEWNSIFTKNGAPLVTGNVLIQNELSNTLTNYGEQGADYLFKGKFAQDLVSTIQANGGKLTLQDLASYQVYWATPLQTTYRGFTVQSGSYRSEGGLQLLLGLKTIENFSGLGSQPHFSQDQATFEKVLRTYLFALQEASPHWFEFSKRLDDLASMEAVLNGTSSTDSSPSQLWSKVIDPTIPAPWTVATGHDSCDTIVIDSAGNIAAGNHTIYSAQWGDYGMMTDGVSLNSAFPVAADAPPGERAIDPLAPVLIFKDAKPWAAAGFFDGSLQAGAFEVLLNLMDYGMNPNDAIFMPRFGTPTQYAPLTIPLDPRYPTAWVDAFSKKGILLQQPKTSTGSLNPKGYADTGDAMVIQIDQTTGLRYGSPSEVLSESVAESE